MVTNDEHVRIWKKSVLTHPTVLHLPVKTQEKCTIKGPDSRYRSHELVLCSAYLNIYHTYYTLSLGTMFIYSVLNRGVSTYHIQYYHTTVVTQNNSQLQYLVQHPHNVKWLNSHT
jgi:hypothetical protein